MCGRCCSSWWHRVQARATVAAVLRDVALVVAARTAAPATGASPAAVSGGWPGRPVLVGLVVLLVLATLAWAFVRGRLI